MLFYHWLGFISISNIFISKKKDSPHAAQDGGFTALSPHPINRNKNRPKAPGLPGAEILYSYYYIKREPISLSLIVIKFFLIQSNKIYILAQGPYLIEENKHYPAWE